MGSISFQVVSASLGTRNRAFAVSDANIDRLVAWAQVALLHPGEESLTPLQALARWAEWSMNHARQAVVQRERENSAVPPFEAT
jgi:hypothetical protein